MAPERAHPLEVRGGRRYGETVVTGSFTHQISPDSSVQVVAYDDIESFGRQLTSEVGRAADIVQQLPAGDPDDAVGLRVRHQWRAGGLHPRAAVGQFELLPVARRLCQLFGILGPWVYGIGIGYENRHYLAPDFGPEISASTGQTDQSVTVDGVVVRKLSPVSSVTFNALAAWYDRAARSDRAAITATAPRRATTAPSRSTFRARVAGRLSRARATIRADDVIGTGLVSLRYQL